MSSSPINSINIRPGVSILSVLKHLNYKPWYALAEFVDNSIQSYVDYYKELVKVERPKYKLRISIEINLDGGGQIVIRDNAAGIHYKDYPRAFRPAALPPDQAGLSEFGMGMKSAACWFAKCFEVRTSALGESVERKVYFDIEKIVRDSIEELFIDTESVSTESHFTEIKLLGLNRQLQGRTLGKIKDHLASIYREFIRNNTLELTFDGELLSYTNPNILITPHFSNPSSIPIEWKKTINFDFGQGLKVYGFAALLDTGIASGAGFALFRKSRVIEGSADEGYKPEYIFKKPNSYIFQRLFGELHLEGFAVSHTKDGFRWENNEEIFLELLKEHLNADPLPLLTQADKYRANAVKGELKEVAELITEQTAAVIQEETPRIIESQLNSLPDNNNAAIELPSASKASRRIINLYINNQPWRIVLELSDDPAIGDWVDTCDRLIDITDLNSDKKIRKVGIRVSLVHPFMLRFCGNDPDKIEALIRVAIAIILAETTARESGVKMVGTLRRNINQYLREALSKP